jgi:hypothetical protein
VAQDRGPTTDEVEIAVAVGVEHRRADAAFDETGVPPTALNARPAS